jgi:hypothetical protein
VVVAFLQDVLRVRFCYENSPGRVARAIGLVSAPVTLACGIAAMFYGTWHQVQGGLALAASGTLFILETPLFPRMCTIARSTKAKSFIYSL